MRKALLILVILCVLPIVYADINDKVNSIIKYGEQYEMGQISYLQMVVHSNALRQEINEMLSEKVEIRFDEHIEYGATEEEMRSVFGEPTETTHWVWLVDEEREIRIDEPMLRWEKTVFDGKKLKITINAWPHVLREEDGSLTKFYWVDFDTRFKRDFDFNINSMTDDIKSLAEYFLETNEGAAELARRMVEYRNIFQQFTEENRENCLRMVKEFFNEEEKTFDSDRIRWEIILYGGDNLELRAEVNLCDTCEWPLVDLWFDVRMRDVRAKEAEGEFKEFNKERYQDKSIDELNELIRQRVDELARKAEQADKSSSGNIMRDRAEIRTEISMINRVLDEKYYGGIEKREERQENYKKRMQALESIFSNYGDIDIYPVREVRFEKRLVENIVERQDSWCRELKQDECDKDEVCWEGGCINAIGGDETCDNKIDDDGDHAIDCDDPDCSLECGKACEYICKDECWPCHGELCGDICEKECWPCQEEHGGGSEECKDVCETGCWTCSYEKCDSQPVCADCQACQQETYECFGVCNECDDCKSAGRPDCREGCEKCDMCRATDTQRECLDFCDTLGDENIDEFVRDCKELCRQDVIFICPTGKQYTPCENVHYVCDGTFIKSVPCVIYICEGGIKQTAPCGQEIMCGINQIADVDKCVCEQGFYDCDDNDADCEATKECQELLENCKDRIDNDGDGLTDCEDLLDCRIGSFCGQGTADEPMYCYDGDCTSTTCGNGICDADETLFSCPPDCKLTKPVCGDEICSGNETGESCPEDCLICPEGQILNEKGVCVIEVVCPIGYINLNGTCTPPSEECIKEGEVFDKMAKPDALCCEGLTKLDMAWPDEAIGKKDACIATLTWEQTCIRCGDGECGLGENWCICPEDCPTPEEVPCEIDADCGTGFCSQEEDICHETKYTCPEGNCSGASAEYENLYCIGLICTDSCGDGVCEPPETNRYCPEDCLINVTCEEGQELSEQGICVDICGNGAVNEGEDCESCPIDVICSEGYICENKLCVPEINVTVPTCPEGQEPNELGECIDICGNGRIDGGEDCESCPKDIICRADFVCENKECMPEKITCPDGYVLNEEGTCELVVECKENQKLTEQGCIPIEDECRQDDECIGKEECKAGVCVAPPKPICETDEECPPNKICSDGICVKNIETPEPLEPEPTGEECILASDCSGENDICSNGKCKEIPKEYIEKKEEIPEEEIVEEEPKEIEEVPAEEKEPEEPEEEIEEEEKIIEEEPEPVEEVTQEPVQEVPEPEPAQEEPEVTGESVLDTITGFITNILGLATEDKDNGCKEDSDCKPNQRCDPFMGECHCDEYYFDCNSRDGQGNDEDGCESQDPTCGGEREICGGECHENQYCDEKRGYCMCNEGFWDCDGYWANGCESEEMCKGCEDDSDCMQDVCAPWDIKRVINFGCVQGSTWKDNMGALVFSGGCNFHPTGRIDPYLSFDAWGEPFDRIQIYQESLEQFERNWCEFEYEHLIKEREELQESYNQEFLAWFFEEYVNNEPDKWDKHIGGIFNAHWKFVDNSKEMNRVLRCLNQNKFPSEYQLVSQIEYESEYGHLKFWEERTILDGVEIFSPYMQIWIFPPKEFIKEEFRTAMEKGVMPGPPGEEKPGPTPAEIKEAKQDKKFMEEITDISDGFGGSADFLITVNDNEEILYKAMLTINPEVIFNFEVKNIENIVPDVTVSIDFDFLYGIIEDTEKQMELQRPPWDQRPRIRETIKGVIDKGKMFAKITGAIATGKIKVTPLSQVTKVTRVLKFMFEQGPKEKGPKEEKE